MALHEHNSGDKSGREMFASRGKIDTACYWLTTMTIDSFIIVACVIVWPTIDSFCGLQSNCVAYNRL